MSMWSGRSIATLHSLAAVGERMLEEQDLPSLYERVVQIALAELQADCAALMLWDGASDHLSVVAVAGLPAVDCETVPLDGSLPGWVAIGCEARVVESSAGDPAATYD